MPTISSLLPQLDAYLKLEKPGFALMVDAPWGAGKTHSVQRWLKGKSHLFVSLYGATSHEDIERAIIMARLNMMENSTARALATLFGAGLEAAAGYFKMSKPKDLQKIALAALPGLLVFDDLERTDGIPVHSLLGILNRYVEHEERHMILLANQAELRKGCQDYDRVREKVVGRVITIGPDETTALTAFLSALAGRVAHGFLVDEQELILSVFRNSESQNLRLLRQALMEYARFHDMVPDDLRDQAEPMRRVLATFLALTIAFHEGKEFGIEDLGQGKGDMFADLLSKNEETDKPLTGIDLLRDRNKASRYVRLYGSALSPSLAQAFIGRGHAATHMIERELRAAGVFADAQLEDWQTLWWWRRRDAANVEVALISVRDQLSSQAIINPWVILHIAGAFLDMSTHKIIQENRAQIVACMEKYVVKLQTSRLLSADKPVHDRDWDNPYEYDSAFGLGFLDRETSEFQQIRTVLITALDDAFWDRSPDIATQIIKWAKTRPEDFLASISDDTRKDEITSYASIPILAKADPVQAAELFIGLPQAQANEIMATFKDRIALLAGHNSDSRYAHWPDERAWLVQVRDQMRVIADETENPILRAQRKFLLDGKLRFLDPELPAKPE